MREGSVPENAAASAGVSRRTYFRWMREGDGGDGPEPFGSFALSVMGAVAESQAARLKRLQAAGEDGKWQADAWFLERSDPEHWAIRNIIQVKIDKEVEMILDTLRDGLPPELYARCLELIAARADTGTSEAKAPSETQH